MIDLLTCIVLSSIPSCFNYFLDYCLGHPMSDKVSTKAIFFSYSYWLAKRRVPLSKERTIISSLAPLLNNADPEIRKQGTEQLKLSIMMAGREYFVYEQALGMCPFCTNFWISQLTAFILVFTFPLSFIEPVFFFLLIPIFSHTILRKF